MLAKLRLVDPQVKTIVSEPRAVATGSIDFSADDLDPVATARGSDTRKKGDAK
jgi:hypothetical protein